MGWLMGLEPKRPGNERIITGQVYERNEPLLHPVVPRIYPWIYPMRRRPSERPQPEQTGPLVLRRERT